MWSSKGRLGGTRKKTRRGLACSPDEVPATATRRPLMLEIAKSRRKITRERDKDKKKKKEGVIYRRVKLDGHRDGPRSKGRKVWDNGRGSSMKGQSEGVVKIRIRLESRGSWDQTKGLSS